MLELFFHKFWTPPNLNLTQVDVLAVVLAESGRFSPRECETILAAAKSQEVKDMLTQATQDALDKGAFGAPWLWVTPKDGKGEPFFGSDRYVGVLRGYCLLLVGPHGIDNGTDSIMCTDSSGCHIRMSSCCLPEDKQDCSSAQLSALQINRMLRVKKYCLHL